MKDSTARNIANAVAADPTTVNRLSLLDLWRFCEWNDRDGDWTRDDMLAALEVTTRDELTATVRETVQGMVA